MYLRKIVVRPLLSLYPAAWRKEYGDEMRSMLLSQPLTASVAGDVFLNAMRQNLRRPDPWITARKPDRFRRRLPRPSPSCRPRSVTTTYFLGTLTVSFLRPLRRRRLITSRPAGVLMRLRKPCVRFRLLRCG